jgi:hypothetical protein
VFDFTDSANPVEIAFFDRGPISETELVLGGFWSAYWHNGLIYGAEIARGLDAFRLTPSEHLTQNEIDAALLVRLDEFNPQHQPKLSWPAVPVVARAYLDQLQRDGGMAGDRLAALRAELDRVERAGSDAESQAARQQIGASAARLDAEARAAESAGRAADARRLRLLGGTLAGIAAAR